MRSKNTSFIWTPGVGPSRAAIDRIRSNIQMPKEPMGEAWFMGSDRRIYTELLRPNAIMEMDLTDLSMLLYEIGSGTHAFGHLREWDEWFAYLLPDLIERSVETHYFDKTIFQAVVTDFMTIYWNGLDAHYPEFREDVFASLSQTIMDQRFWSLDEPSPRPKFLDLEEDGRGELKLFWGFGLSNPSVSAGIFFSLKYLEPEEVKSWTHSLTGISHPLWQGNLMAWFLGAFELLQRGAIVPGDINAAKEKLEWDNSHLLGTYGDIDRSQYPDFNRPEDFLPSDNLKIFFETMTAFYTDEKLIELADDFTQEEHLNAATHRDPERLMARLRK